MPGVVISEPGTLHAENAKELRRHVDSLVARLLRSVRAPAPLAVPKATALVQELSKTFRKEKLLGRGDDLSKNKVVRNVAVSSDGSLRADFVAKNRFLHVTETVDLRTPGELTTDRLKDIAVAAVTLDEAKRTFGRGRVDISSMPVQRRLKSRQGATFVPPSTTPIVRDPAASDKAHGVGSGPATMRFTKARSPRQSRRRRGGACSIQDRQSSAAWLLSMRRSLGSA